MGRTATQQPKSTAAGLTVKRAAWVIQDLEEYVPHKSAERIVTNTLLAANVDLKELPQSCEDREAELQAEIVQSQQTVAELEHSTEETILSLQEQIASAYQARDARLRQEQHDIEQALSEISELQRLQDLLASTEHQEPYEASALRRSGIGEEMTPADDEDMAGEAGESAEHSSGEESAPQEVLRLWRSRYGLSFVVVLLPLVLLCLAALSYSFFVQPQTETGSKPDDPPSKEESGSDSAESARRTNNQWEFMFARNPLPSLATPTEGASVGYGYGGRIALTFDDGPSPKTTLAILDTLAEHDIKATFFVNGEKVKQHPKLIRRIVREGHTLGNHTYDHKNMAQLPPAQMRRELTSTQRAVDRALGRHYELRLMRPPFGEPYYANHNKLSSFRAVMRELRSVPVLWTIDSHDWAYKGQPRSIVRNVIQRTDESGGVLLLHDTSESTVKALPRIIARYQKEGFEFASVPELLTDKYSIGSEEQSSKTDRS